MSDNKKVENGLNLYLRLMKYIWPNIGWFILSVIGFLMFALSQPALASMMDDIIKAIEAGSEYTDWERALVPLTIVGIFVFRGAGSFIGDYFIGKVARNLVHTLRNELFEKLLILPINYFDKNNSGQLIYRVTSLVDGVTGAATNAITVLIREGATVLVLLAYLFYQNWKLTLVFMAITPVIALIVAWTTQRLRKLSRQMHQSRAEITQIASEAINGIREIRSFSAEQIESERFRAASRKNIVQEMKRIVTQAGSTPIIQTLIAVAMGIILWLVLNFSDGDAGNTLKYIVAAALIPKSLRQLTKVNGIIQQGLASAQEIFQLLDEGTENDGGNKSFSKVEGRIEYQQVNFCYPEADENVLHDINLVIEPGENIAIVGASGSGKSTMVNLLTRFYDCKDGKILLDAHDVQDYSLKSLRKQISIVSQQVTLFNGTIKENIAFGILNDSDDEAVIQAAKDANILEFIESRPEGLNTEIGEDGVQLSGGQRQRLAIARALLKNAPILILDEATSALDTESERNIQQALERVMKNRTTLVIAHRLSTIEKADRIVVMQQGRIMEVGKHQELLAQNGIYAQLHAMQFSEN